MNATYKPARSFEDLVVWQKAHELVLEVYPFINQLPDYEKWALADQMRRSSVSVPTNIVEGFGRRTNKDKLKYYNISKASLDELRYLLILARDLKYGNSNELLEKAEIVGRMLVKFMRVIESKTIR